MMRAKSSLLRVLLLLAPLSLALGACETLEDLSPFDEKKTPVAGDRRALFPQGVPGVQYNAPPQQPTNSNVQIPPQQQVSPDNPDAQPQAPRAQQAPNAPAANNSEDPWAGQRR
jgi:hypothetical protein